MELNKLRLLYLTLEDMRHPFNVAAIRRQIGDQERLIYSLI